MFNDLPPNLAKLLEDKNTVPSAEKVFRCFSYFQPKDTKVIIIGQDPYPNRQDASGLAFSVEHNKIPGSLRNIIKELVSDVKCKKPKTGNLESWAHQGVLLLNPVLTTRSGQIKAHYNKGWQSYTKIKIQKILDLEHPIVIIAWGKEAQNFTAGLEIHDKVLIIQGNHPSPINRHGGFKGKKYFSRTNSFLKQHGISEIRWNL